REYTYALIREFGGGCDVTLVGSGRLAALAESQLRGEAVADADIAAELAPCFVTNGTGRTDIVVLACTHYPLLSERLERLAPWPVTSLDPAPAIARRVRDLVGPVDGQRATALAQAVFTSDRAPSPALADALRRFGIDTVAAFDTSRVSA